eukprot:gene18217-25628_t
MGLPQGRTHAASRASEQSHRRTASAQLAAWRLISTAHTELRQPPSRWDGQPLTAQGTGDLLRQQGSLGRRGGGPARKGLSAGLLGPTAASAQARGCYQCHLSEVTRWSGGMVPVRFFSRPCGQASSGLASSPNMSMRGSCGLFRGNSCSNVSVRGVGRSVGPLPRLSDVETRAWFSRTSNRYDLHRNQHHP